MFEMGPASNLKNDIFAFHFLKTKAYGKGKKSLFRC